MRRRALLRLKVLLPLVLLIGGGAAAWAQCAMEWKSGFGVPGMGTDSFFDGVYALAVFDDDGDGRNPPALYAAGSFWTAGDAFAQNIARWDGTKWSALPGTLSGSVYALCVYDDGTGPALYVGGAFGFYGDNRIWNIAKWDGANWSYIGSVPGYVYSLTVFDDGAGPALYVGGQFTQAGGVPVKHIARWDGSNWSALGSGIQSFDFAPQVRALAVYDDGSGPALYGGGHFSKAGGVELYNIARWNGSAWSMVGYYGTNNDVYALTVYTDLGSKRNQVLYAGGRFTYAGQTSASRVAKWDGANWSALGAGVSGDVSALAVFDDGSGPVLYVGGNIWQAGDVPVNGLARWDGSNWSSVGSGVAALYISEVWAVLGIQGREGPVGPGLYVGGEFTIAGGIAASYIARWDGSAFSSLGTGNGVGGPVNALSVFDDGTGPALYAGGEFATAGPLVTMGIARWDGSSWSDVGGGMDGSTYVSTVFDDGTGAALYVGGSIYSAGGVVVHCIAKWDGTTWSALGSGMNGSVEALGVFDDDGPGPHPPALYAGGYFTQAGGVPANRIAKWDGTNWSALGSGISGASDPQVYALCVYDDGTGPALYVGGSFTHAGSANVKHIAKWNGTSWSDVGGGMDGGYSPSVRALSVFDDGSGPVLFAGGGFTKAGGLPAPGIAKWNGSNWSSAGGTAEIGGVPALTVFDDGTGPALYAAGGFVWADGHGLDGIFKWRASEWWLLPGAPAAPRTLCWSTEHGGALLYVGGYFYSTAEQVSSHFAKWGCVPGLLLGDLDCDGLVDSYDIDPFVLALVAPGIYHELFPNCNMGAADCNGDGALDAFDIDPFVTLLIGP
jgi:hypothetical protein